MRFIAFLPIAFHLLVVTNFNTGSSVHCKSVRGNNLNHKNKEVINQLVDKQRTNKVK